MIRVKKIQNNRKKNNNSNYNQLKKLIRRNIIKIRKLNWKNIKSISNNKNKRRF